MYAKEKRTDRNGNGNTSIQRDQNGRESEKFMGSVVVCELRCAYFGLPGDPVADFTPLVTQSYTLKTNPMDPILFGSSSVRLRRTGQQLACKCNCIQLLSMEPKVRFAKAPKASSQGLGIRDPHQADSNHYRILAYTCQATLAWQQLFFGFGK